MFDSVSEDTVYGNLSEIKLMLITCNKNVAVKSKPCALLFLIFVSCNWQHRLFNNGNDHCYTLPFHSVTRKIPDKLPWNWNAFTKYGKNASFIHNKNVNGCNLLVSWWSYLLIMCNASLLFLPTSYVNNSSQSNKRRRTTLHGVLRGKSSTVWITSRDGLTVYLLSHCTALIYFYCCYTSTC